MKQGLLFLQNRTHRAGAQTCLARILGNPHMNSRVSLLCSESGWLTRECTRLGVPFAVERFPTSRTLLSRAFGNAAFALRAAKRITQAGFAPAIVHANDHIEGLLGLALAKRLDTHSAIFLRSSAMTKRDYYKYGCDRYDLVIAVGNELHGRAQSWDANKRIELIYDGIAKEEFLPPKPKPDSSPSKILVIGNAGEAKGWGDLANALLILEAAGVTLPVFDFTGDASGKAYQPVLERLRVRCSFIERTEDFQSLVRNYDLVLNPSRNESFGMAAIEVLAAGVPLLSSRTGVIEQVQKNPEMLFEPNNPEALAGALDNVLRRWNEIDFGVAVAQRVIRERFLVDHTAAKLDAAYRALLGSNGADREAGAG